MLINIIIFNILWNIQFTTQIPLETTHTNQFSTSTPIAVNQYRNNSVHTIITDDHINKILEKLGSSTVTFTTESSPTPTIETSSFTNLASFIPPFQTMRLPINPDIIAPDGSLVRNLLTTIGGSMAQFDLPPGMTSNAVEHQTVYEIWYFLSGQGEFWRKQKEKEEIVTVDANVCITIPVGTQFQFRTIGHKPLVAVAITMPPWPGHDEAMLRPGIWNASFIGIENSSTKLTNSIYRWFIIATFLIVNII
ncbi:unnamed protein product [Rotaria sp. Silwood2]|nr:unnamed protein product [Rotaria sp. Silwood2]CAF2829054.1 unnamed protein product [Rotaria sp. Silwood2]CAF3078498.1 unnamed protein product [Rotaria sp. Silwood2]CAF3211696.1 unnamed protein product [Rotaria sp. Silwood2]CAF4436643.1 unnamed protein product [Rotaria sp. Silwood2]